MEVVRLAANPTDGICYNAFNATGAGEWSGPPGTGIIMSRDLERRLNFTTQLVYCHMIWGQPIHADSAPDNIQNFGIIARLEKGEADWSPCLITRTLRRLRVVDFSNTPYHVDELIVGARNPGAALHTSTKLALDSVLRSFNGTTWFWIETFYLLYGLMMSVHLKISSMMNNSSNKNKSKSQSLIEPKSVSISSSSWIYDSLSYWISLFAVLVMRSLPKRALLPDNGTAFHLVVAFWLMPSLVLSTLYCTELIGYLATIVKTDLLVNWNQLFEKLLIGQLTALSYAGNWLHMEASSIFGKEIEDHIFYATHYEDLINLVLHRSSDSEEFMSYEDFAPNEYVWIDSAKEMLILLNKLGVIVPQDIYLMGIGHGLGLNFAGFAFSRHRPEVKEKFDPWIQRYFQYGFFKHWDAVSDVEVLKFYSHSLSTLTKMDDIDDSHQDGETGGTSGSGSAGGSGAGGKSSRAAAGIKIIVHQLDLKDLIGSLVSFCMFLVPALCAIMVEKLILKFIARQELRKSSTKNLQQQQIQRQHPVKHFPVGRYHKILTKENTNQIIHQVMNNNNFEPNNTINKSAKIKRISIDRKIITKVTYTDSYIV